MGDTWQQLHEAVGAIRDQSELEPDIAVILGSGLGALAEEVDGGTSISYADIPHFPLCTAPGHSGRLVLGNLERRRVAVMTGRPHLYEGYSAEQVAFPVHTMRRLGAEVLVITNAAGGVNAEFAPGTLMAITDHLNLTGRNPLVGPNDPRLGPRFPDMSEAYSRELRSLARMVAEDVGVALAEGVYAGFLGPSFETPAEVRMAEQLGADAVGMSTVMEVIAANYNGMRVLGVSCITNLAAGKSAGKLTEVEVLEIAAEVRAEFAQLIRGVIGRIEVTSGG